MRLPRSPPSSKPETLTCNGKKPRDDGFGREHADKVSYRSSARIYDPLFLDEIEYRPGSYALWMWIHKKPREYSKHCGVYEEVVYLSDDIHAEIRERKSPIRNNFT